MKSPFGSHTGGGDAGERLLVGCGEEGVYAFVRGECCFEAVGSLDVPGGEDQLAEQGSFDGREGAEFIGIGRFEGIEFGAVFLGEQHGLGGVEAEFGGVGSGAGFAFRGARSCGKLGISGIGFDLRGGGHDGFFSFEIAEGG